MKNSPFTAFFLAMPFLALASGCNIISVLTPNAATPCSQDIDCAFEGSLMNCVDGFCSDLSELFTDGGGTVIADGGMSMRDGGMMTVDAGPCPNGEVDLGLGLCCGEQNRAGVSMCCDLLDDAHCVTKTCSPEVGESGDTGRTCCGLDGSGVAECCFDDNRENCSTVTCSDNPDSNIGGACCVDESNENRTCCDNAAGSGLVCCVLDGNQNECKDMTDNKYPCISYISEKFTECSDGSFENDETKTSCREEAGEYCCERMTGEKWCAKEIQTNVADAFPGIDMVFHELTVDRKLGNTHIVASRVTFSDMTMEQTESAPFAVGTVTRAFLEDGVSEPVVWLTESEPTYSMHVSDARFTLIRDSQPPGTASLLLSDVINQAAGSPLNAGLSPPFTGHPIPGLLYFSREFGTMLPAVKYIFRTDSNEAQLFEGVADGQYMSILYPSPASMLAQPESTYVGSVNVEQLGGEPGGLWATFSKPVGNMNEYSFVYRSGDHTSTLPIPTHIYAELSAIAVSATYLCTAGTDGMMPPTASIDCFDVNVSAPAQVPMTLSTQIDSRVQGLTLHSEDLLSVVTSRGSDADSDGTPDGYVITQSDLLGQSSRDIFYQYEPEPRTISEFTFYKDDRYLFIERGTATNRLMELYKASPAQ